MFDSKSKRWSTIIFVVIICIVAAVFGLGGPPVTELTGAETKAISEISGVNASAFLDISSDALGRSITEKYRAVEKVYLLEKMYAFVVKPVAYNGPVTLALVIDGGSGECMGMRIVEHTETKHYVRDMESAWFIERFTGKSADEYLDIVRLNARNQREIVAITGATVTTEAIVNGVNAAFGVYQEYVLHQAADAVPYMVRFEPGQGDGPVETGNLAIRAYGLVLAEISLDEIKALPSVKRSMSIQSSSGTTQHSFKGTLLSNVLDHIDRRITEDYDFVLAVGVDDYISDVRMDEILAENSVYIMYEDNDEPLTKKSGEPGAMRIVVINDVFGQRFTNYLLEIVLEGGAVY